MTCSHSRLPSVASFPSMVGSGRPGLWGSCSARTPQRCPERAGARSLCLRLQSAPGVPAIYQASLEGHVPCDEMAVTLGEMCDRGKKVAQVLDHDSAGLPTERICWYISMNAPLSPPWRSLSVPPLVAAGCVEPRSRCRPHHQSFQCTSGHIRVVDIQMRISPLCVSAPVDTVASWSANLSDFLHRIRPTDDESGSLELVYTPVYSPILHYLPCLGLMTCYL